MSGAGLVLHPPAPGVAIGSSMFNRPERVATMLDAWHALMGDNYVRQGALQVVPEVCRTIEREIEGYLQGELRLPDYVSAFAEGLRRTGRTYSRERTIADLWTTEAGFDRLIKQRVANTSWPAHINFFAYGVGDGHYENTVRSWLIEAGVCDSVSLYGYDPNASVEGKNITLVDVDQLATLPEQHIFVSRWVLHHVPYEERWDPVTGILNRMAPGGVAFVAEEGVFAAASRMSPTQRAYSLLMAMLDTLINAAVLGHWFEHGDFFVEYLTEGDLATIEASVKSSFRRQVVETPCDFLREVAIVYEF